MVGSGQIVFFFGNFEPKKMDFHAFFDVSDSFSVSTLKSPGPETERILGIGGLKSEIGD